MPRNGSGSFGLVTNSWNPATTGVSATPVDWQALINDVAAAITQSLSADGQTPVTGNISMGNNKLTGLAAGTGTGDSLRWQQLFSQGQPTNVASASTIDIGAVNSTVLTVTGTTTITSFGTNYNGPRFLRFADVLILTNGASLVLPTAANITTAAGDTLIAVPLGSPASGWQVVAYQRASGAALVGGSVPDASDTVKGIVELATNAETQTGTDTVRAVTPAGLASVTATDTRRGLIELATTAEAEAGTDSERAITPATMRSAQIRRGTSVTASGTAVDFTGLPSWVKRLTVLLNGVSTTGSSTVIIQLGTSSGFVTTGYTSAVSEMPNGAAPSTSNSIIGIPVDALSNSGYTRTGAVKIFNQINNVWIASASGRLDVARTFNGGGVVDIGAVLDRVRITTSSGTDTFDSGSINIFWE